VSQSNLSTGLSSLLQKLSERLGGHRTPAGYRPGATLAHLQRNMGLAQFTVTGPSSATAMLDNGGPRLEMVERTESQLLMHIVMTEFNVQVPALQEGVAGFVLHHGGAIRRRSIRCRQRAGDPALLKRLQAALAGDRALHDALMPLDFKRLQIDLHGTQWQVRIEHMGGSEVVSRMPAFRRYIALSADQRHALLQTLYGFQRILPTL